jgi:methyl-accepting chemotaxis protein
MRRLAATQAEDASQSEAIQRPKITTGVANNQERDLFETLESSEGARNYAKQSIQWFHELSQQLNHISENLIMQQPDLLEFTRRLYPHLNQAATRAEKIDARLSELESMTEQFIAQVLGRITGALTKLKEEEQTLISLYTYHQRESNALYQKYRVQLEADLGELKLSAHRCKEMVDNCKAMVLESRNLSEQMTSIYQMASSSIDSVASKACEHIESTTESSVKAVEESRQAFLKSFKHLDATLWEHPWVTYTMQILITALVSVILTSIWAFFINK